MSHCLNLIFCLEVHAWLKTEVMHYEGKQSVRSISFAAFVAMAGGCLSSSKVRHVS